MEGRGALQGEAAKQTNLISGNQVMAQKPSERYLLRDEKLLPPTRPPLRAAMASSGVAANSRAAPSIAAAGSASF
jgi:hypothetical protein